MRRAPGSSGPSATTVILLVRGAVAAAIAVFSITDGEPASAIELGFNYALDEFRMTGNVDFFDDFEDGSRTTAPTSSFVDYNGTVTVEQDGFLVLSSANGSFPRPDLGQDFDWIEGFVDAPLLVDGGDGTSTITASFRPDVPPAGYDGAMFSHYGIYLGTEGSQGVEIAVQGFLSELWIFFYDDRSSTRLGTAVVPASSIAGNIVLELVVDHLTDTVVPRYSVDGGATFVDGADWTTSAGLVFDVRDDAFVGFFALGAVPEPGTDFLFGAAAVTLGGIRGATRRNRTCL